MTTRGWVGGRQLTFRDADLLAQEKRQADVDDLLAYVMSMQAQFAFQEQIFTRNQIRKFTDITAS